MRPLLLAPEMLLFGAGLVALVAGSFLPRRRQWWVGVMSATAQVGVIVLAALQMAGPDQVAFEGAFSLDTATGVARIACAGGLLLIWAVAGAEMRASPRESETYALLMFSATGVLVLAGADDLLLLVAGYFLASIPLYGLVGLVRSAAAAEAAMKAYLMGALFGILLMLGVTILYGLTGATRYPQLAMTLGGAPSVAVAAGIVGVLAGLMFEAGGVPAHFWVPDAAQGANATAATFLTTVPKIGALVALYRLATVLPDNLAWPVLIAVFACASMTLGNLAAYWQHDPRRLLGWSTVSQVGYLLVPITVAGGSELALPSLLFYLGGYTVTNIAAFAVTAALPGCRDLDAYRGLARTHPWLAGALVVALLGLVGTPPTAVFIGKVTTAAAAWDGGYAWLAVVVFVNTLVSLFYYLRWIVPAFRRPEQTGDADGPTVSPWPERAAVLAAALSLAIGITAGPLWQLVS
ncbi:NADH-quinone oxidoreductase subunit N [Mycolicibacterium rhodesiae]|uniref:NADH-quinone oxidoreductase subunit N n=1 Tax=Mycolicibacterium rhodesiae TaxID=36814 RepID=A0A1X0IUE3_MYCRH|nr:NADH-quinone oxidoreductase subunit N [Mycolicibacterium rhodesiae]MCV7346019.1 NADH-quinone oxidoreductase subunit N [Mycolicibacterium rhodesiae]ORB52458.1 NADH-quinone oxidoreductase subunit N [Mycolicibacterium rhodesiae]